MKKFFLIAILLLTSISVGVCRRYPSDAKRVSKSYTNMLEESSWCGLSIGYNSLICSDAPYLSQSSNSINININVIDANIVKVKNFSIFTGLGFEFNNFRFDGNNSIVKDGSGVIVGDFSYDEAGITLSKSKLNTNYVVVPLLAEFNFDKGRSYIDFGVIGGWMYNAHTKIKYSDGRYKSRGLPISNLRYGYCLMMGRSSFGLYARYYPDSIFRDGKGPNASQLNVGVHFTFD